MSVQRSKTSRSKQAASAVPLRQTRSRSKLGNAASLMTGLNHRGEGVDPLSKDPENLTCDEVRKLLNKTKIILHVNKSAEQQGSGSQEKKKTIIIRRKSPPGPESGENSSPEGSSDKSIPQLHLIGDEESSTGDSRSTEDSLETIDEEGSLFVDSPIILNYPPYFDQAEPEGPYFTIPDDAVCGCTRLSRKRSRSIGEGEEDDAPIKTKKRKLVICGSMSALVTPNTSSEEELSSEDMLGLSNAEPEPRTHYDWYEQWHTPGSDCPHVHEDLSHVEWNNRWNEYYESKNQLYDDLMKGVMGGEDVRKDFMGALMENSAWRSINTDPLPPVGGSLRVHPAREARRALSQQEAE